VGCLACRRPLRRFEDLAVFYSFVTDAAAASHEIGCPTEYYEYRSSKHIGLLAPAITSAVSSWPTRYFSDTVPRSLAKPGSSSRELDLLYRVRSCFSPAQHPEALDAFHGVWLPFVTSAPGVH
jgi:hypothetical protein